MGGRVAALAVLLAGCSIGGSVSREGPPNAAPTGPAPIDVTDDEAQQLGEALAGELLAGGAGAEPPGVEVVKAIRTGDAAFAVASAPRRPGADEIFASLTRRGEDWQVADIAPIPMLPPRGSNAFLFQTLTAGVLVAHGGFVDPDASLVDTLDPFGRVVDEDEPFSGAAVVLSERFGLLRVHESSEVLGALQIAVTSAQELELLRPMPVPEPRRAEAMNIADRFVDSLLEEGWAEATSFYNPDGRPDLLLPPMETVVEPGTWSREGSVDIGPRGFIYPISGPDGSALLHVQLTRRLGEWKVTGCALSTPPEDGTENVG
jgi:hypothetical protein